jgi:AcrR family transcriptional regulator
MSREINSIQNDSTFTEQVSQPLSKERIISTALNLVDSQGLDALSMRNLAQLLGVKAMSLYNHVQNKDEIVDLMIEHVIGEVNVPDAQDGWIDVMRCRAISLYKAFSNHPWAIIATISRVTIGPRRIGFIEQTLAILNRYGISLPLADHIMTAIDSYTYGFVLQEINMPIQKEDYSQAAEHYLPTIETTRYPHFTQLAQEIIAGRYDGINHFEFGLELLLQGLKKKLPI